MNKTINCPVNFTPVNQNKLRVVALFVFLLSGLYLLLPHWSLAVLLVVDFLLRSFNKGRYSYLGHLSDVIVKAFSLPNKPVDSGPKKFAAQIGFFLSSCLLVAGVAGFTKIGVSVAAILSLFSLLEAAFAFCAGCHVYTFYQRLSSKRKAATALPSQW